MYCNKCGKELKDGAKFCGACGAEQPNVSVPAKTPPRLQTPNNDTPNNDAPSAARGSGKIDTTLIKVLLLAGMLCFFLPFVMVSCSGEQVECSGFEIMMGGSSPESSEYYDADFAPNIFLIGALVLGVIALIHLFMSNLKAGDLLISTGLSMGAAFMLILCKSTFWSYYEDLQEVRGYLQVDFEYGWVLSLLAFGAAGLLALFLYILHKQQPLGQAVSPPPKVQPNEGSTPNNEAR